MAETLAVTFLGTRDAAFAPGDAQHLAHVLLDDHRGHALRGDGGQHVVELLDHRRRQAQSRVVA